MDLIFNWELDLFTPEFILKEFEEHRDEILAKTKKTKEEFNELIDILFNVISVVGEEEYLSFIDEAKIISPDSDDIMYFALALKLNCSIWSNDKRLKNQSKVKIYSTEDLVRELG